MTTGKTDNPEKLKTPRGAFTIRVISETEADADGFSLWFQHGDYIMIGNGTVAFAVHVKDYHASRK